MVTRELLVREVPLRQRTLIRVWQRTRDTGLRVLSATPAELASLAILLVLTAAALSDLLNSRSLCRQAEESRRLITIGSGAKRYFIANGAFPIGRSQTFPPWSCCPEACGVVPAHAWAADPIWGALDFSIDEASQVRYTYESLDGQTFRVTAVRDARCNGDLSTYVIEGSSKNGNPSVNLIEPPPFQR